jgi:hypothetical protein
VRRGHPDDLIRLWALIDGPGVADGAPEQFCLVRDDPSQTQRVFSAVRNCVRRVGWLRRSERSSASTGSGSDEGAQHATPPSRGSLGGRGISSPRNMGADHRSCSVRSVGKQVKRSGGVRSDRCHESSVTTRHRVAELPMTRCDAQAKGDVAEDPGGAGLSRGAESRRVALRCRAAARHLIYGVNAPHFRVWVMVGEGRPRVGRWNPTLPGLPSRDHPHEHFRDKPSRWA